MTSRPYHGSAGEVTSRKTPAMTSAPRHGRRGSAARQTSRAVPARTAAAARPAQARGATSPTSANLAPEWYPSSWR
jgi:hypothetical protein